MSAQSTVLRPEAVVHPALSPASSPAVDKEGAADAARTRARQQRGLRIQLLRVGLAVALLGGWEMLARLGIIDVFFFGQPSGIADQIWRWVLNGTARGPLWEQVAVTLEETILGFLIGVVLGIVFGVLLGRNRDVADVFGPYIKGANSMPRVVLGSIFIIWFGLGLWSKVALAVVLVFFVVFFNAFQGVREVDRNLLANARILGASPRQVTTEVIIPSALSWIIASLHTSFGFALVGAVVGEYLGSVKGLGLLIATAQNTFNPNGVFAAMAILAAVALLAEAGCHRPRKPPDPLAAERCRRRDHLTEGLSPEGPSIHNSSSTPQRPTPTTPESHFNKGDHSPCFRRIASPRVPPRSRRSLSCLPAAAPPHRHRPAHRPRLRRPPTSASWSAVWTNRST